MGVRWHRKSCKWQAQIHNGTTVQHIGVYDSELEAAKKFDERAAAVGKPVNFPDPSADPPQKQAVKVIKQRSSNSKAEENACEQGGHAGK